MRQHFVPKFYLKHFTTDDGFFYIYDVKNNRFKKNGQKFAPNSHFYQEDANTIYSASGPAYFIEDGFTRHDNRLHAILQKTNGIDKYELSPQEWTSMQYFTSVLYWRNPANDAKLRKLIANAPNLSTFGMKLVNPQTGRRCTDEEEKNYLADPQFFKMLRLQVAGATYPEAFSKDVKDFATIISFPPGLPKFVSDNPVIHLNEEGQSIHTCPMIFPLSPTKVLFRHLRPDLSVPSYLRAAIDKLLFLQASEYVASSDIRYSPMLYESAQRKESTVETLKNLLLTYLI